MNKKVISLTAAVVLMMTMSTTAITAAVAPIDGTQNYGCGGYNYTNVCYNLMRAADGSIASKNVFEANLDAAIANGTILEADRQLFLDMYDVCSVNSGLGLGLGCGNGGAGRGMGRRYGGMR